MIKKNPFLGFSEGEVASAEASYYTIQIGDDLFFHKGKFVFNKRSAIIFYNRIINSLLHDLNNGTDNERKRAKKEIQKVLVRPLRVQ